MPEARETVQAPAPHLDQGWLRANLEALAAIRRPSGSPGERVAAEWVAERLGEHGADARIEEEQGTGGYWLPLGIASLAGVAAGAFGARGRRLPAIALGTAAALAAADDMPPDGRRRLRGVLPQTTLSQVVAEIGPKDAERTVVVHAHHDAAHSGLIFHPALPEAADRLGMIERSDTSPPLMWLALAGPLGAALGGLVGSRALARAGALLAGGFGAAMGDIAFRDVVPGANDNGTGVIALLALARAFAEAPPGDLRVILLSTSEEATCEGMAAFMARHGERLPRERTFFLSLDTLGSPHLLVLRGEGMTRMREYPAESLALLDGLAEERGIELFPNLRLRNATDGVYPLAAGYQCASVCSCTRLKQPANYHWPTDVPENVDYDTVADGIRLAEAVVRRLADRWL